MSDCPETYWRVAWGASADRLDGHHDYPEQWDAVAYFNLRENVLIADYGKSADPAKRLEEMTQAMSNNWNVRAIHDGRERNLWLWEMQKR